MKILLVTTSYPEACEGSAAAGVFVREFANTLTEQGHSIAVVAPGAATHAQNEDDVVVFRFLAPRQPLSLLKPQNPRDWLAITRTLRAGQQCVDHACNTFKPDFIFALWALPSGAWAKKAAQKLNIPYGIWALGSDIWTLGRIPLVRQALRHTLRQAALRYADGLQLTQDVKHICNMECGFLPSTRKLNIYHPRQLANHPPYRLAFLGRWHSNKGIDLLLDALLQLDDSDWQHIERIRIFGGGPMETQVHAMVQRLRHLHRPVELGGYLDTHAASDLLNWTDIVLIPSRIESIPVIFSDAMQATRPVVSMPVGDLPSLLQHHACGELAEQVTAPAYAQALRKVLHNPATRYIEGITSAGSRFNLAQSAQAFIQHVQALP